VEVVLTMLLARPATAVAQMHAVVNTACDCT